MDKYFSSFLSYLVLLIKQSLDLIDLKCYDKPGLPIEVECAQSQSIREKFNFLFVEVISKMEENLTQISSKWDLNAVKAFPKEEGLRTSYKNIKPAAEKLATIYMNDTSNGKALSKKLKSIFGLNFGRYVSYRMGNFHKDVSSPIISDALDGIGGEVIHSCKQEDEACKPSLIKAFHDLYLPFFVMKFPLQKLGFGQFLSYFSRLETQNDDGIFLSSNNAGSDEEKIEEYLVNLFDDIVAENDITFNVSVFELIKVHQFKSKAKITKDLIYASYLMKKFGCGGIEQKALNLKWIDWSKEKDEAVLAQRGKVSSPPCQNLTEASQDGYIPCCKATNQLRNKLLPILKVMKYAAQPPHFIEDDLEMNLTFKHGNFLKSPLVFPIPSNLDATGDRVYGDSVLNSNPKIPLCQYSGNPEYPSITKCDLFSRSITNEGLGYTFNGPNFWAMHAETPYTRIFSDIMYPKKGNDSKTDYIKEGLIDPYTDADIEFPETSGPSYGLSIVLDSIHLYSSSKENSTFQEARTPFKVRILIAFLFENDSYI